MDIYETLMKAKNEQGGGFFILVDPDRSPIDRLLKLVESAAEYGADAIMIGSSFMLKSNFHRAAKEIKDNARLPVIIFPGAHSQVTPHADAILFTSLLSGRNPQYLIEEQVKGAPLVREYGIEPIPTGYMLIESGQPTSVEFISNTRPLPDNKPDIVCAHALAAQYMGMKMIFLEAGSGAKRSVPENIIESVASYVNIPIIVGGGIRTPREVEDKISAGASFVIIGDHFENSGLEYLHEFAQAAHPLQQVTV